MDAVFARLRVVFNVESFSFPIISIVSIVISAESLNWDEFWNSHFCGRYKFSVL